MARSDDPSAQKSENQDDAPPSFKRMVRRLWPELRPHSKLILFCAVLTVLQSVLGFTPPFILGDIVNRLQKGESINTVAGRYRYALARLRRTLS